MSRGLLVIDGSNIGYAASSMRRLTVGDLEVQGVFGTIRTVRKLLALYGSRLTPIVLWDGRSWRRSVFKGYKANRDQTPQTKAEKKSAQMRASAKSQRPLTIRALRLLGVPQMMSINMEADDLAGILVRRSNARGDKVLMISGDKDWIQLVGPNVGWSDIINNQSISMKTLEEKLGVKTPQAWLEVKALMGDVSDNIPGVGGIGEKGAKELVNTYGSVANFFNQAIDGTLPKDLHKKFRDLLTELEKKETFYRNMKIMDLQSKEIPTPINLKFTATPLDQSGFRGLCKELMFKSILNDFEDWTRPFKELNS